MGIYSKFSTKIITNLENKVIVSKNESADTVHPIELLTYSLEFINLLESIRREARIKPQKGLIAEHGQSLTFYNIKGRLEYGNQIQYVEDLCYEAINTFQLPIEWASTLTAAVYTNSMYLGKSNGIVILYPHSTENLKESFTVKLPRYHPVVVLTKKKSPGQIKTALEETFKRVDPWLVESNSPIDKLTRLKYKTYINFVCVLFLKNRGVKVNDLSLNEKLFEDVIDYLKLKTLKCNLDVFKWASTVKDYSEAFKDYSDTVSAMEKLFPLFFK